jgi:hypothetical protein
MARPRISRYPALLLALLACAFSAAGCAAIDEDAGTDSGGGGQVTGGGEQHGEGAFREGLFEEYHGLEYKVFLTRQLNPRDPEDRAYIGLRGPEAPPGQVDYGVFVQVCNMGDRPRPASRTMTVIDTLGNEFEPLRLAEDNVFAYRGGVLQPNDCIPDPVSIAAQGPVGGALLVYRLPLQATENRPLRLEVRDTARAEAEGLMFELDI